MRADLLCVPVDVSVEAAGEYRSMLEQLRGRSVDYAKTEVQPSESPEYRPSVWERAPLLPQIPILPRMSSHPLDPDTIAAIARVSPNVGRPSSLGDALLSWRSGAKPVRSPKFTLPGPPGSRGANRPRTGVRPPHAASVTTCAGGEIFADCFTVTACCWVTRGDAG